MGMGGGEGRWFRSSFVAGIAQTHHGHQRVKGALVGVVGEEGSEVAAFSGAVLPRSCVVPGGVAVERRVAVPTHQHPLRMAQTEGSCG